MAQVPRPLECGAPEAWTRQPRWVSNPASQAEAAATHGVLTFRVGEPGRGTKWSARFDGPLDLSDLGTRS
jgi:hypothetical protein